MSDTKLPYDPEFFTPVPNGLVVRLVDHATRQLQSELRWVDPDLDGAAVLEKWLDTRLGGPGRSLPTPSAEPGDLLVKLARGEFWTFSVHGWRELGPIMLSTDDPDLFEQAFARRIGVNVEFLRDDALKHLSSLLKVGDEHNQLRVAQAILDATWQPSEEAHPESLDVDHEIDLNRIIDEGGAVRKRTGYDWPTGGVAGTPGGSVGGSPQNVGAVYDPEIMQRTRDLAEAAMNAVDEPHFGEHPGVMKGLGSRPIPGFDDAARSARQARHPLSAAPEIIQVLDELQLHADTLQEIAGALREGPGGGNDDPLFTAAGQAESFSRALEYARTRLWAAAAKALA